MKNRDTLHLRIPLKFVWIFLAMLAFPVTIFLADHNFIEVNASKNQSAKVVTQPKVTLSPDKIFDLVNVERQKIGAPMLVNNPSVVRAAQEKCDDMVAGDYYAHKNPQTGQMGYEYTIALVPTGTYFGENLDKSEGGIVTDGDIVTDWLNSPRHKEAMLRSLYTDSGVAICQFSQPYGFYVVQEFVQLAK